MAQVDQKMFLLSIVQYVERYSVHVIVIIQRKKYEW